jgi:hypothetical protein
MPAETLALDTPLSDDRAALLPGTVDDLRHVGGEEQPIDRDQNHGDPGR